MFLVSEIIYIFIIKTTLFYVLAYHINQNQVDKNDRFIPGVPRSPLDASVLLRQRTKLIWCFMCTDIFFVWFRSCSEKSETLRWDVIFVCIYGRFIA